MLSLHIKNMGEGCAKCVRIQLLKDYHVFHDPEKLLSNHQVFQEGINVFPSGYELHYNIDWWDYITGHGMDDYIELCVTCSDINGKEYGPQNYTLKFSQIRSCYSVPPETYMGQIAYYLKEIHKVLNNYYGIIFKKGNFRMEYDRFMQLANR